MTPCVLVGSGRKLGLLAPGRAYKGVWSCRATRGYHASVEMERRIGGFRNRMVKGQSLVPDSSTEASVRNRERCIVLFSSLEIEFRISLASSNKSGSTGESFEERRKQVQFAGRGSVDDSSEPFRSNTCDKAEAQK